MSLSDPWDLGEALGWKALPGQLLLTAKGEHGGRGLIKLDDSVTYKGVAYRYLVAGPRAVKDRIADLLAGKSVFCALTGISDERAESADPLDTSWWRGGLAIIGNVERA